MGRHYKFRKPAPNKATNVAVTPEFLAERTARAEAAGFEKAQWVVFCETLMKMGFALHLYEARKTVSKYVTVAREGMPPFKVRFSNHKPIFAREAGGDCDYFVGVTNFGVQTTGGAFKAVLDHAEKFPPSPKAE